MHSFIVEQLAAEHVKGLLAAADDMRRARQARHPPARPVIIDPGEPHS